MTNGSCVHFSRQHNVFKALAADYFHVEAENLFDQSVVFAAGIG